MNDIVIGYGEIGRAVRAAICPEALVYEISNQTNPVAGDFEINVMHICIPYSEGFVRTVTEYIDKWQPKSIAVWSSTQIGTVRQLGENAVHTPVEGKHPNLSDSILKMTRWVGYNNWAQAEFFKHYFNERNLIVHLVEGSNTTEALKLLSTTEYGVNIVYADYKKRVADAFDFDYKLCKEFNEDYNSLYQDLGLPEYQKFVLNAPAGSIGGHCVVPNAILLNDMYPDGFLQKIIDMKPKERTNEA